MTGLLNPVSGPSGFEVFATTPEHLGLDAMAAHARHVESLGFDGLFVPDAVHDGLLLAGQALAATRHIRVATSVLVAFPRSPMNVALAAWDLQRLSGGRFELGLGTQIRQNIEDRYSARWLPPVDGMRDYVAALRAIFRSFQHGEPLHFIGKHYQFTRLQPFFNPGPLPDGVRPVPIQLGAVGPKMLMLAGACADGLHIHPTSASVRVLRELVVPQLTVGQSGRVPEQDPPVICLNALVATGCHAEAVAGERERYRRLMAFLFSTPAYMSSLAIHGWLDRGHALQDLARARRWADMPAIIDDTMLDTLIVSGVYGDPIVTALRERFSGLITRIAFPVPENPEEDAATAATVKALRNGLADSCPDGYPHGLNQSRSRDRGTNNSLQPTEGDAHEPD